MLKYTRCVGRCFITYLDAWVFFLRLHFYIFDDNQRNFFRLHCVEFCILVIYNIHIIFLKVGHLFKSYFIYKIYFTYSLVMKNYCLYNNSNNIEVLKYFFFVTIEIYTILISSFEHKYLIILKLCKNINDTWYHLTIYNSTIFITKLLNVLTI